MKHELSTHRWAYLILILGLVLITLLFLGAWPNRLYQRFVILGLVVFYSLWGTLTHLHADHLTKKIAYEYMSMSLLAGALLFLVTV